jgi:hypothetical protein
MLADYQERLDAHFKAVAKSRVGTDFPIFALEHGLNPDDVGELVKGLSDDLVRSRVPRSSHWLLWTVCAAEIGYAYDGEEYWQSFKRQVDGWDRFGDRETIRTWFKRFSATYSGFVPQGRWAEHFSIIAWPIAHSILPRDLQTQFARFLYDLRYDFGRQSNFGMDGIESLLRLHDSHGSSRFNHLLEQTKLLAAVVMALRDENDAGVHPLLPQTLARVVSDMSSHRAAREWLKEARHVIKNTRVAVAADLRPKLAAAASLPAEAPLRAAGPRLVARKAADGSVVSGVAIPDIRNILRLTATPETFLKKTRVAFYDTPETWMPAQSLLALSNRERVVAKLPLDGVHLFAFEDAADPKAAAVSAQLRIQGPLPWLLRKQDDGVFRQVFGKHVRPGQDYLLAVSSPFGQAVVDDLALRQVSGPDNAFMYELALSSMTGAQQERLSEIGVGFSLRASVSPAGLMPRWEENGSASAWLPNEEIILRLSADFDVTGYLVSLGKDQTFVRATGGRDVWMSVGKLPIGEHSIEVTAIVDKAGETRPIESEIVYVRVRPPVPWRSQISSRSGFSAVLQPPEAKFEEILAGRATLVLAGPADRNVTLHLSLFDANGRAKEEHDLGSLRLPVSAQDVTKFLNRAIMGAHAEAALSTPRVDLVCRIGELGQARVSIRQDVDPFRWKIEQSGGRSVLRLIDEAGADTDVSISQFSMERPDERTQLDRKQCEEGIELRHPGSLLMLQHRNRQAMTLACPTAAKLLSLSELGTGVAIFQGLQTNGPERITKLVAAYRRWRTATLLGPLAMHRKQVVLQAIITRISQIMCGPVWINEMNAIPQVGWDERSVARIQRGVGGSQGFAARIRRTSWKPDVKPFDELHRAFFGFAKTYGVSADAKLCSLALALALDPKRIRPKDAAETKDLQARFEQIAFNGVLARGAFFAKFATTMNLAEAEESVT